VPSRGTRWKSVFVAGGLSPPAEFVKQLFSRTTTVSLLTQSQRLAGPSGKDAPDCGEWRCGCLLKDDLEQEDGAGGWRCPREAIAPNWEHVLVLDPEHATGWMARIEERPPDVFLRKQFASGDQEDFSFLSLRKLAAETMLDALVRHASQGRW